MDVESFKTKCFCETSFKNDMLTADLTSVFQYERPISRTMCQKYGACHNKSEPSHTKSCTCQAKWNLKIVICRCQILQPFHDFGVSRSQTWHWMTQNPCACHAKCIFSNPLQIHQRFGNPHELLRLPRTLWPAAFPAPATRNALWTFKNVASMRVFDDFDFEIALSLQQGANFWHLNLTSKSGPKPSVFNDFDFEIALSLQRDAFFQRFLAESYPHPPVLQRYPFERCEAQNYEKTQHFAQIPPSAHAYLCSVWSLSCALSSDLLIFSLSFAATYFQYIGSLISKLPLKIQYI